MSRSIETRIRCHLCYYGNVIVVGRADDLEFHSEIVEEELERRDWGKDADGHDVCDTCLEAIDARGKRLAEIRLRQAALLLKACGLEEKEEWAAFLVEAQELALQDLKSGNDDFGKYMADRMLVEV